MKHWIKTTAGLMLAASLVLSGCGSKPADNSSAAGGSKPAENSATGGGSSKKGEKFKIAMVTDIGGVNDKSFNQSAWEGLNQLKNETGAQIKNLQSKSDADYVPNLNQFVKDGYNLTWGIGFLMGDAVKTVATQNPKAQMAIIDNVVEAPNVESVTFAENEGAFLTGVVAGLTTTTNKIGFVGGIDIPVIKRFEAGFKAGVAAVNPNAKVTINYTGAFDKPDLGKAAAATIFNDGADIIFHAAGATGNGVFNEAKDRLKSGKKVWVIGVDKDQSLEFGDDVTLTSMLKRVDQAVVRVSNDLIDGKFQGGKNVVLGLKDNGVGLPDTSKKNVKPEVLQKVEEYKQKIIKGEIKVPEK
ncbi:BMP family ABC transporter substrate-binding protein [Paenibacillus filicis]|uniref:BMP family ABC transporter substrate-binding protein n=1 Tax=Paenibacillus gyeongsangnamensis TaxID=3388067 RepID=A0ABT4QFC3_9BACL|nr:BMP family ABC transporter substrate-binding protein [Paenibacillus filicis]MCZ8515576.1 BMP family ABC transporter substrate-binding protein [Paenibacillus filicis]